MKEVKYLKTMHTKSQPHRGIERFLHSNIGLQVITKRTEVKWLSVPIRKINSLLFKYQIEQLINEIGNRSSELFQLEIVTTFLFKYKTGPPYYSIRIYENHSFPMRKSTSLLFQYENVPVYYSNAKKYQSIIAIRKSTSLLFQYEKITVFIPIRNSNNCYFNAK